MRERKRKNKHIMFKSGRQTTMAAFDYARMNTGISRQKFAIRAHFTILAQ